MATVLYVLAETIRNLSIVTQPFMPSSSEQILKQLSVPPNKATFESFGPKDRLAAGAEISRPEGIFPRIYNK